MGTPLPPNEPGNLCAICWGAGKPLGDSPTPTVIQARLTSLLPGFAWNPDDEQLLWTTHYLTQRGNACEFRIQDGTFEWFLFFGPTNTHFSVTRNADGFLVFFHGTDQPCELDLDNELTLFTDGIAHNGFANLTWDLEGLE